MNYKIVIGCCIATLFVGSVIARVLMTRSDASESKRQEALSSETPPRTSENPLVPGGGNSLVPGGPGLERPPTQTPPPAPKVEERPAWEEGVTDSLPVVTEASFFGMLGFALGFAARKVIKVAMLFVAIFFVLLQLLAFAQIVTIDWARAVQLTNDFVLNLKENQSIGDVLKNRIPTAGSLVAGYFLGFRRG